MLTTIYSKKKIVGSETFVAHFLLGKRDYESKWEKKQFKKKKVNRIEVLTSDIKVIFILTIKDTIYIYIYGGVRANKCFMFDDFVLVNFIKEMSIIKEIYC